MFSEDLLYQILHPHIQEVQKIYVAYSGGLDSTVLLKAISQLKEKLSSIKLIAIHINHGLSPNAKKWEQHCQIFCDELNIQLQVISISIQQNKGDSLEAIAREKRYQAFADVMEKNTILLTAHQLDDQAETLLLQLFRGAGIEGLAAMPIKSLFLKGNHLRPLLNFPREELKQYAQQKQLTWIDDESNFDTDFARNYLRHEIFPILKKRYPSISKTLTRSASHLSDNLELLDDLAKIDYEKVTSNANTLFISKLKELSQVRRFHVIRYWLKKNNFAMPNEKHLIQLEKDVIFARSDANPKLTWANLEIHRFNDQLYAMEQLPQLQEDYELEIAAQQINSQQAINLPENLGRLIAVPSTPGLTFDKNAKVKLKFRRGGEVCQPYKHKQHHQLKKLMQEWKVPPWKRERIPIIYIDELIAQVVGYCLCEPFTVEQGWKFEWR